jgi:endonuclease III
VSAGRSARGTGGRKAPFDPGPAAWDGLMATLDAWHAGGEPPSVTKVAGERHDPFRVLVATLLSLRTQDPVTEAASNRLFALADTPSAMAALDVGTIAAAIRPVNFYPTKAARLRALSQRLLDEFDGEVPADLDVLLTFDGVGRKTANLVLTEGFDLPGLCVDTHVHRIPNRLGWIATKDPHATEMRLRQVLPVAHWKPINALLVSFGQQVCRPTSPRCSACPLADRCARVGVTRSR